MRVSAPPKAAWYGSDPSSSTDDLGGYEVRRRDWRDALSRARSSTRHEWESRTVYVVRHTSAPAHECIPLAHRAVPHIYHFIASLLGLTTTPEHTATTTTTRIQCITLPPHHLDRPGDAPKPKGFAFVTFSDEADAARLATDWPWLPRRAPSAPADQTRPGDASLAHDAAKVGFRVLRKARWDELKEEYLSYRQRLLDQTAASAQHAAARGPRSADHTRDITERPQHAAAEPNAGLSADDAGPRNAPAPSPSSSSASFPPGCLVYVRNVHAETNKTTLRALFGARAFASASAAAATASAPAALDYVDYSKGMTSCHLRLSAPHHAQALVAAFHSQRVVQRQGLDDTGTPLPEDCTEDERATAISVEIVQGMREELYWSKVPEKVRREAVRKAIAQTSSHGGDETGEDVGEDGAADGEGQGGKRKRKRRKKA
ncbi:hypothetical protein FKP32DRAFT_1660778 [Trametes sanguinea]|nr:hypothetical protein FKP32DRAFT_1660778 [Trametes sanguinea]